MAEYSEALSELSGYPKALSHAGAGGGANLKTLNIVNNTAESIYFYNCIVGGYWGDITVGSGETAAVQYVTPIADEGDAPIAFIISVEGTLTNVTVNTPEGITYVEETSLDILNGAEDGATVTFTDGVS